MVGANRKPDFLGSFACSMILAALMLFSADCLVLPAFGQVSCGDDPVCADPMTCPGKNCKGMYSGCECIDQMGNGCLCMK
jgi:hypothetical protein